jgi:Fe-S-cluster containining protein
MNGKKRAGSCRQCGNCCRDFIIDIRIGDVTDFEFTDYLQWINCHANVRADIKNFKRRDVELLIKTPCKYLVDNGDGKFLRHQDTSRRSAGYPERITTNQPEMRLQVRGHGRRPGLKIFICS